jgi:hypothetical protein
MHECTIHYDDCIANKHHRIQTGSGVTSYLEQRGATITSNVFHDRTLILGERVFDNLLMIIKSAKKQGFEKIELNIRQELVKYYLKIAYQVMALEQVVIETANNKEEVSFFVYFPEALWKKASSDNARGRTSLHSKYMNEESLLKVQKCCELPKRSDSALELLKLTLDLDD